MTTQKPAYRVRVLCWNEILGTRMLQKASLLSSLSTLFGMSGVLL